MQIELLKAGLNFIGVKVGCFKEIKQHFGSTFFFFSPAADIGMLLLISKTNSHFYFYFAFLCFPIVKILTFELFECGEHHHNKKTKKKTDHIKMLTAPSVLYNELHISSISSYTQYIYLSSLNEIVLSHPRSFFSSNCLLIQTP